MTQLISAVKKASGSLNRDFSEIEQLQSSVKGYKEFVVMSYGKVERALRTELAKIRPDYPIAIVLIFALCALLIGIRGRRGIERLSVLIGLTMLLLAFISLFTAGPAGEGQRSLYLFFLPSITVAACCTAAEKARPGGVLTGILISFAVYLGLYFSQSNLLLSEIAVITGAVFRSAVIALAALKTIKPRLWAR